MKPVVSIIIPTKNAGLEFSRVMEKIFSQTFSLPFEVIIIDSGSTDLTLKIAQKYPIKLVKIKPEEFGHGRTRNLGAKLAQGKYLVFLTQDALPANRFWLKWLIKALRKPGVAGVYGQQEPRPQANPLEVYYLKTLYPFRRLEKKIKKKTKISWRETFFSNANAAIKKKIWSQFKFNEKLIMSEDQDWAKRVLLGGYSLVYEPRAAVYHSHPYGLRKLFKRNFDSGASLREITGDKTGDVLKASLSYLKKEVKFLFKKRKFFWLLYLPVYELARFSGFFLGRNEDLLPAVLKKRLSLHRSYRLKSNFKQKFLFIFWVLVSHLRRPKTIPWRIWRFIEEFWKGLKTPPIYRRGFYPGSSTRKKAFYHQLPFSEGGKPYSCRTDSPERLRILRMNEDFRGKRVLDLGCNVGYFALSIVEEAQEVVGVDRDRVAIGKAKELAQKHGIKNVTFMARKITPKLLNDLGRFDIVLALSVLPWINQTTKNPEPIWRSIFKTPVVYVELMYHHDRSAGMKEINDDQGAKIFLERYSSIVHPIGFTTAWSERTIWRCAKSFGRFKKAMSGHQSEIQFSARFVKKKKGGIWDYYPEREFAALKAVEKKMIAPMPVKFGRDHLLMSRLQGRPFDKSYPKDKAAKEFKRIARSLKRCQVIHRDIQPNNLVIGIDDRLYLLDFAWAVVEGDWYQAPKTVGRFYRTTDFDNQKSFDLILENF